MHVGLGSIISPRLIGGIGRTVRIGSTTMQLKGVHDTDGSYAEILTCQLYGTRFFSEKIIFLYSMYHDRWMSNYRENFNFGIVGSNLFLIWKCEPIIT